MGSIPRTSLVFLALLLPTIVAQAQTDELPPPAVQSTAQRHLGFFLRMELGADYFHTAAPVAGGGSLSVEGPGVSFGLLLGGAVTEDWILAGDVWAYSALSLIGSNAGRSSSANSSTVQLMGVGLNVTHYFMPANVYVSFSPSAVLLSGNDGHGSYSQTLLGFGGRASIGKEWWVSDHWGFGVALELAGGVNKDQGGVPTWSTVSGGLAFTATYN
jgi:hypothetical protein